MSRRGASRAVGVLLVSMSASSVMAAQLRPPSPFAIRSWAKREGLPEAWVSAVLPSRSGYLWLATPDGLVRFDGSRFTVYDRKSAPGLPADRVQALHQGRDGRLWVGTRRGLAVGDDRGQVPFAPVAAIPGAAVGSIDEDADGSLWIMMDDDVWRLHGAGAARVAGTEARPGEVYAVLRSDASGGFWLGGNRGLTRVGRSGDREAFTIHDGLPSDDVLSLLIANDASVWVGTGRGAAVRGKGGSFQRVSRAGDRIVMALAQDRHGDVWAATRDGVLRLTGDGVSVMGRAEGLPDEHTRSLAVDGDGNLWIGTEAGGLARLRDARALVYGTAQGLGNEVIWSVAGGRDGSLWIATDGGGLDRLRGGSARLATSEPDMAREKIYALLEDHSGILWFSTESHGLCRLVGGRAERYAGIPVDVLVRCLMEDGAGRLWIGVRGGLFRVDPGGLRPIPFEDSSHSIVETLLQGPDGVIWVGTSSGLARVDGDVVRRVRIAGKPHDAEVDALNADRDGTLWIGTVHGGLQRLRAGRLAVLTSDQGLPTDTVLSVLDDGAGRLWISAVEGIFGLERADVDAALDGGSRRLRAVAITEAEGLRDRECSGGIQPSAWRAGDGRLYYPTIAGVAVVDPRRVSLNERPLRALIEGILADGKRFAPGGTLDLPAGTRHLEIEYAAPSFVAPERVRFETRLEGLEATFFPAGADRVAHYTGLRPGRYGLEVRAANEDGVWAAETASLTFRVRPYFWQARWFYGLTAAVLLLAVWTAVQVRTRTLRLHETELQRRVAEELAEVRVLSGLLPICAWCRKVRDDAGYWTQLEAYVRDHTHADFTHGICPECRKRLRQDA